MSENDLERSPSPLQAASDATTAEPSAETTEEFQPPSIVRSGKIQHTPEQPIFVEDTSSKTHHGVDAVALESITPSSHSRHFDSPLDHFSVSSTQGLLATHHAIGDSGKCKPTTEEEAQYLQYFVHTLAPPLDVCDSDRHFATDVPRRALQSPILLQSIYAWASLYMFCTGRVAEDVSFGYYDTAIQLLIPILDQPSYALSDDLLAVIVILRSYEEYSSLCSPIHDFCSKADVACSSRHWHSSVG